jgi:hypothetical protein
MMKTGMIAVVIGGRHNGIGLHIHQEARCVEVISSHKDVMTTNLTKDQ